MTETTIQFTLNGEAVRLPVGVHETLLQVLRDRAVAPEAKSGCERGDCGACAVAVDDIVVNSCLTLAVQVDRKRVTTVRGIGTAEAPHPLQAAFLAHGAAQCGMCIPGMLMCLWGFLREHPRATRAEIREAIAGNLCRCTGYQKIVDAAEAAARQMAGVTS